VQQLMPDFLATTLKQNSFFNFLEFVQGERERGWGGT